MSDPRPTTTRDANTAAHHDTWTVFVPAPTHDPKTGKPFPPSKAKHVFLSSNARVHDQVRAAVQRAWRHAANECPEFVDLPSVKRARIVLAYHKPRGGRYDPANLYPTGKPIVDALVDLGIIEDDDHKHVVGPDPRHGAPRPHDPGVLVTIERLP